MADVEIHLNTRLAAEEDDIKKTIDYIEIYEITHDIITRNSYKLVETIAERIAERILEQYDVSRVSVSIRKLKPAIQGVLDYIEIKICRERSE